MRKGRQRAHALWMLMRPWHVLKNVLVLMPAFFGGRILAAGMPLLGFVSMSLASSAVYALNDVHDAPQDRLHPAKRSRPVASGEVTPAQAVLLAAACMALSLALPLLAGASPVSLWPLLLYLAANLAYSLLGFKDIPIVDVTIVALGFVLRVMYGGLLAGV